MTSGQNRHSVGGNGRERRGPAPAASASAAHHSTPFVGRDEELSKLRAAFDQAASGAGRLVVIAGEPGIGKTRICRELETYALARGAQVLWGGSHEASGAPPYWPWLQTARQWGRTNTFAVVGALSNAHAGELARLFPELAEAAGVPAPGPAIEAASAQFRLFDAFAALLQAMTSSGPLVVVLEDLHWADRTTIQLLEHVARALAPLRMLIVCTYRDTDLSRVDPLSGAIAELNRDPGFVRLVLHGLSMEAVRAYIRESAGVEPTAPVVELLHESTEGNPFLLAELVQLLTEDGSLTTAEASDIRVPQGVREALGRRLDRLSEGARELMLVAAIAGREFTYDELDSLRTAETVPRHPDAGRGTGVEVDADDALVTLIEEGVRNATIEEMEPPGRYRFTHALMQETLLGELSTTRRALLHGRVGEALERRWGDLANQRASRLAGHFLESSALTPGHLARARRYARLAGEQAERQFSWPEAVRWYQAAIEGFEDPEPKVLRALANAWVRAFQNFDPRGIPFFVEAVDAFRKRGDLAGLAETVADIPVGLLVYPFAAPLLQEAAEASAHSTARVQATLRWQICMSYSVLGEWEVPVAEKERRESELLAFASHPEVFDGEALRAWVASFRANRLKDFHLAAQRGAESARIYQLIGRPFDACHALIWAACRAMTAGALRDTLQYAETLAELGTEYRDLMGNIVAASLKYSIGWLRAEAPLMPESGTMAGRGASRAWRALVGGRASQALEALSPAQSGSRALFLQSSAVRAAVLFDAQGPTAAAADFANWAKMWRLRVAGPPNLASSISWLARALPAMGDDELCREVYDEIRNGKNWCGFRSGIGLDAGRGMLALRLGLVDEARQAFDDGLEWAEREGCPVELGRNLQGLADVAALEGDVTGALARLDRAGALFQQHGAKLYLDDVLAHRAELRDRDARARSADGSVNPALALASGIDSNPADAAGSPLSPRESEVLRMLATGLRNREIADQLVISERTVERHVSNIYRKLDARGKADATAWALRAGLI